MTPWPEPSAENQFLMPHVTHLLRSYRQIVGNDLIEPTLPPDEQARNLYFAPYAVVSHNVAEEPIFNYANRTALQLFAMTWEEFTALPSRLSAEPLHQPERARLFEQVRAKGYIDDYRGVRIAKTGRRFWIENATVWTLYDDSGQLYGQAALFAEWRDVE